MTVLLVFIGGAIGTLLRFAVNSVVEPVPALWIVNVVGSFLMGLFQRYFMVRDERNWQLFLTTGMLGAFTTFSAFSAQWLMLVKSHFWLSMSFAFGMTLSCIIAAGIGFVIYRRKGVSVK